MSIGIFNNRSGSISKCLMFKYMSLLMIFLLVLSNLKQNVANYCNTFCSLLRESILNIDFALVIVLLVLMSGDVAENPGPGESTHDSHNCLSLMHLNIRSIRTKIFWNLIFYVLLKLISTKK